MRKITLSLITFAIFIPFLFTNRWFSQLTKQDPLLLSVLVAIILLLVVNGNFRQPLVQKMLVFLFFILVYFQISTTNVSNTFSQNPAEIDLQTSRMNYYDPKLARLGYYLEKQPLTLTFYKLEENFFNSIDLNLYFPNYFNFIVLPFFLIGLYLTIVRSKFIAGLSVASVIILTITGVNGKLGPAILFPFIGYFIYLGVERIVTGVLGSKK